MPIGKRALAELFGTFWLGVIDPAMASEPAASPKRT